MDDIKIKACSPDNGVALTQLVSVFRDSYGDQFPFPAVYDVEYWSRNIGSRFISVVAARKNHIQAHIAARPEPENENVVQLCFPACSEALMGQAIDITSRAWSLLESIAQRQKWSSVYYASFSDIELMQRIGVESFGTSTSMLLPEYIPLQNPRCAKAGRKSSREGGRSHIVVGQRILDQSSASDAPLYIPERHKEISSFLLKTLGVKNLSTRMHEAAKKEASPVPADSEALQSRIFNWGAANYVVRPTMLSSFQQSLFEIRRAANSRSVIFVDARDSRCPEYAEFLEQNGFMYSGIAPALFSTESIVYSQTSDVVLDSDSFVCPVAKELARYMNEHVAPGQVLAHPANLKQGSKYATARS
ncbi:MAG: hypothetical protein J0M12_16640 [Deltaproteobacteria bacterium]|nr:hypothetical protein [Deltaproteobacteria bacterium]